MTKTKTLVTTTTDSLPARQQSNLGLEHLTADDVAMPRLSLAQAMSDQVNRTHADWIEGLGIGDMFNSVSMQNYGPGKLFFAILVASPPRAIEFASMDEGGGMLDPNVPLNDPRLLFGADGSKPRATRFYDYILMINPGEDHEEMISLSLARSGVRAAKALNGLARMRGIDVFRGLYTVESIQKTSSQGSFQTWRFRNAGTVPEHCVAPFAALHTSLAATTHTTATVVDAE
jgi:hypothetical protein